MPRLLQFRLVSLGHSDARMDDFTMQFMNGEDMPENSVVWLRNGGGKSSILNMFFAGLRPDKRDFLGSRADRKLRRIEDYVLPREPGASICEWELDDVSGSLDLGEHRRHLTGVFYEKRPGVTGDGAKLRRMFFATPVSPDDSILTIEGIPLFVESDEDGQGRRNLSGFRQEWTSLRDKHPHLQVFFTDNQREWKEHLDETRKQIQGHEIQKKQLELTLKKTWSSELRSSNVKSTKEMVTVYKNLVRKIKTNTEKIKIIKLHINDFSSGHIKVNGAVHPVVVIKGKWNTLRVNEEKTMTEFKEIEGEMQEVMKPSKSAAK